MQKDLLYIHVSTKKAKRILNGNTQASDRSAHRVATLVVWQEVVIKDQWMQQKWVGEVSLVQRVEKEQVQKR